MGGAALGYAIGSAVERNNNFNDCMQARGWRIADGGPATQDGAMTAKLAGGAPLPPIPVSVASQELPVTHADYHATMVPVTPAPVRHEFLVRAMDMTPAIAASMNLNPPNGVEVISVDANGAAWASGIRNGDVIRTFNGMPITGISDMRRILSGMTPGETVEATIWRSGSEKSIQVSF
jgi:hypothetical protein